jgi:hypothetical protein
MTKLESAERIIRQYGSCFSIDCNECFRYSLCKDLCDRGVNSSKEMVIKAKEYIKKHGYLGMLKDLLNG